ncbi:PRTRC system protein C [Capnocytophaga canimorsus]|uniref:PRTRC system protein C n=1 Tax=Capnocytophaga canimorsus TaxID=28188 RepID=UPI0038512749
MFQCFALVFIAYGNNQEWSVEMVQHFYAPTYPILTTAKISAPRVNGEYVEYHFETSIGTKG